MRPSHPPQPLHPRPPPRPVREESAHRTVVMRKLGFVDEQGVITLKGQAAACIDTTDELLTAGGLRRRRRRRGAARAPGAGGSPPARPRLALTPAPASVHAEPAPPQSSCSTACSRA
jgi:hypothetical protein